MKCESCGENDASVELTQVVEGDLRKWNLCEACAEEKGIEQQGEVSLTDILFGMGGEDSAPAMDVSCPGCHMRRSDFKQKTRFGCPQCYRTFETELGPLLMAMHKGERHVGKIPRSAEFSAKIESLQAELDDAVKAQNYELAAELRDRISACKNECQQDGKGDVCHVDEN